MRCGIMEELVAPHRDHPAFELTRRFCRDYDAPSFDPAYDSMAIEAFVPIVEEVLGRPYRYSA